MKKTKFISACDGCRKRKVKCDGIKPNRCTNCRNKDVACTYNNCRDSRLYKIAYVQDLEDALSHCQSMLNSTASTSSLSVDSLKRKNNIDHPYTSTKDSTIIPTTDYEDLLDDHLANCIDGLYIPPDDNQDSSISSISNVRFFGKASMRALFSRVELYVGINSANLLKSRRPQYWVDDWSKVLSPQSYMTNVPYANEDFGDDALLANLVDLYFDKVNVTMPLLNESHFRASIPYRKLERGFGSVLMMVAALGSLYSADRRVFVEGRKEFLAGYIYYITAIRKMPNYTTSSAGLEDIQALILVQFYVQRGVHTKSSSINNGLAILLSENIGLHNQWMNVNRRDVVEKESRKRAWWILYIIDRSNTACFGRQILIKDEEIDLELPQTTAKDFIESIVSIKYVNDIIKLCGIHGEIMNKLYKFMKSNVGESKDIDMNDIAYLNSKIHKWLNELSIKDEDVKDELTYQLHCNLKLAYHNVQIILYRPFMPYPKIEAPTSNLQLASMAICANASRSIISIYNSLILVKRIERCLTDCMISWCPLWATLILVIEFCEGRRNGNGNAQNLDYIKTGILVLRADEDRNVLYGRAVDILLPIVKAILPPGDLFIEDQEIVSYNKEYNSSSPYSLLTNSTNTTKSENSLHPTNSTNSTSSLPQNREDLIDPSERFYYEMLEFMQSQEMNMGQLLNSNVPDGDFNTIIDSMLNGDHTSLP